MSVCVVLGMHRSGTSAVAGVLYHLGMYMGTDLLPPGAGNPKGHFEDREFLELHNQIIGDWRDPLVDFEPHRSAYTTLIRYREQTNELWGVKDPRMCFVFPYFADITQDVRVISIERNLEICATSLVKRGWHVQAEAFDICKRYMVAKTAALMQFDGPVLTIKYADLVAHPESTVHDIAHFVGLELTEAAIRFIDPQLDHSQEDINV